MPKLYEFKHLIFDQQIDSEQYVTDIFNAIDFEKRGFNWIYQETVELGNDEIKIIIFSKAYLEKDEVRKLAEEIVNDLE